MLQPSDRKNGKNAPNCASWRRSACRVALCEHGERGAQARARRRPWAGPAWPSARQAKVSRCAQAMSFGDEALQEQGRGDAAGHRRAGGIGEVGDVALEHLVIAVPQRHPPQRVLDRRSAAASMLGGKSSRLANSAGRSGPSAIRAAPVRVAKSTISSGLSSAARVERVGEDQPPLGVGIVDLDGQALARLDDVAGAVGGAGHRILDRRDQQMQPDRQALGGDQPASASAWAAPPMSFFISRMPLAGLRSSPPLSKHTPLPTIATRGWLGIAPFELDQPRRALARGAAGRPRRSADSPRSSASPDVTRTSAPSGSARSRTACSSSAGPRSPAGVLTRSRTRAVASARRTICVDPRRLAGDEDPRAALGVLRLGSIVVEAVLGEQPAERRLARARPRPAVGAFGQRFGELGEAPGRQRGGVGDRGDDLEAACRAAGGRWRSRSCRRSGALRAGRGPRRCGPSPNRRSCPCRRGGSARAFWPRSATSSVAKSVMALGCSQSMPPPQPSPEARRGHPRGYRFNWFFVSCARRAPAEKFCVEFVGCLQCTFT